MKRVKSRFTLIEMLAVVAIASILIALITPAVQGLMFGSRVDQYASNFKLGMEQAQSKAFASRKYVALVLPYNHSVTNDLTQYCKGGYRMAYVTRDGNTYNFERWVDNNNWKNPNAGALCIDVTSTGPTADTAAARGNWADAVKNRASTLACSGDFNSVLTMINNVPDEDAYADVKAVAGTGTNAAALIFSPYGGVVNNDLPIYFTFTEAKIDGGRYAFDNIDNILVLKLNPITGQVTYFDPYAE